MFRLMFARFGFGSFQDVRGEPFLHLARDRVDLPRLDVMATWRTCRDLNDFTHDRFRNRLRKKSPD